MAANTCPICGSELREDNGQAYCPNCKMSITSSVKLGFEYKPGSIVDCTTDSGQPGYKAAITGGKCYAFQPGNEESKKNARRKALIQDYHHQRRERVGSISIGNIILADGTAQFSPAITPDAVSQQSSPSVPKEPFNTEVAPAGMSGGGAPFENFPQGDTLNNPQFASKKSYKEQNMYSDDVDDIIRTAKKTASNVQWFNGTSASIYDRLEILQSVINELRTASSHPDLDNLTLSKFASSLTELELEKEQLQKLASEYVDFDTENYLQNLPGGTVASTYRTTDFGTADLGEDDGSFLYQAAKDVEAEVLNADWINFVTAGAETWVEDQNERLLESQSNTREAASYYVEDKTMPILDVEKRAAVINNFIDNVEICRREKNASIQNRKSAMVKKASNDNVVDGILGNTVNWF